MLSIDLEKEGVDEGKRPNIGSMDGRFGYQQLRICDGRIFDQRAHSEGLQTFWWLMKFVQIERHEFAHESGWVCRTEADRR